MRAAALVEVEGIEHPLLRRYGDLIAVEIHSLGGRGSLQLLQLLLVATPLVCNHFATLEAADWDDHSC